MARYVDGFVLPMSKKKVAFYRKVARSAGQIWKKYGAVEYIECAGEDLATKMGLSFSRLAKVKPGETVVFSWIVYKSKAHRNQVNAKVMKDPRMVKMMANPKLMPFDVKRMAYGGFKVIVDM